MQTVAILAQVETCANGRKVETCANGRKQTLSTWWEHGRHFGLAGCLLFSYRLGRTILELRRRLGVAKQQEQSKVVPVEHRRLGKILDPATHTHFDFGLVEVGVGAGGS